MISPNALFSTRYNLQKIYMEGTTTVNIPILAPATVYNLVDHDLGYIPTARVFYIPVTGQLWPISPHQYSSAGGGSGTTISRFGSPVLTSTSLGVRIRNTGAAADITFYWRIYLDE